MKSEEVLTTLAFIREQINSGNLWPGKQLQIDSKYCVEKEFLGFKVGTVFIFYGFGHDRFESLSAVCLHIDGSLAPETYFVSDQVEIESQIEASVRALGI